MSTDAQGISARFTFVIVALCKVVAAHIAADRTAAPWIVLVCNRLRGIARHVERLAAQARAGTVPTRRAAWKLTRPRKPATRPPIVLAGKPGWLFHRCLPTAPYASYLRQLLDDPEMAALLAAAPQLARILRPLCRALGVAPPPLPPPPPDPPPPDPAPVIVTSGTAATPATAAPRRHPARRREEPGHAAPLLKTA